MKIEKRECIYKGFYTLNRLHLRDNNNDSFQREQFVIPNSIGALVHDIKRDKVILVRQFRIGPQKDLLEIVAGKIEGPEKDPQSTAKREIGEETGYQVDKLHHLFSFHPCPGPVSECMELYYAEVSSKISAGGGLAAEHEDIQVVEMDVEDFIKTTFNDAKTIIAQQWMALNKS